MKKRRRHREQRSCQIHKECSLKRDARRIELKEALSTTERAPVLIHPNIGQRCAADVQNLIASLNDQDRRIEAAEILRKLIDRIILSPNEDKSGLVIDLVGDLAGILLIAEEKKTDRKQKTSESPEISGLSEVVQIKLVAGASTELSLLFNAYDLLNTRKPHLTP